MKREIRLCSFMTFELIIVDYNAEQNPYRLEQENQ